MSPAAFREIYSCGLEQYRRIVGSLPDSEKPEVLSALKNRLIILDELQ